MLRSRNTLRIEALERRELMAVVSGDFNGDGFQDVAYGEPDHNAAADIQSSGAVSIQYGTAEGLQSTTQAFDQDSPGVPGMAESGDQFGAALAVGDFNGDGYDDLAVGAPDEDTSVSNNGAVHIFYGSFFGLETRYGLRLLTGHGRFGASLAVGRFNADGYDDLAIGAPSANGGVDTPVLPDWADGHHEEAGRVLVYHGSRDGIGLVPNRRISQEGDIKGNPEDNDHFGSALAAGDFNGDGYDDLAVGTPGEDYSTFGLWENKDNAGAVNIVNGSADGLVDDGNYLLVRENELRDYEHFGGHLAAGDFNGDGISDLVVVSLGNVGTGDDSLAGIPVSEPGRAGAVGVYYGSSGKLGDVRSQRFDDLGDYLASASPLAVGDLNGDTIDDLVFADPFENDLYELHGGPGLLRSARTWHTTTPGLEADRFNFHEITAGDYNGDGTADIAIRAPKPVSSILSHVLVGSISNPPGLGGRYGRLQVIEGTDVLGLQVAGNYVVDLHGPGDGSGIVGLANTATTGTALSGMAVVEEDAQGAERLTDAAVVEKLYQQVLARAPDEGGLKYHVERLEQGAPLSSVAAGIFESPERLDPTIAGMYRD